MSSIRPRRNIRRFYPRKRMSPAARTYFNAVNLLKSRRNLSRRQKKLRETRLRRIFKNSIRQRNRRILRSKLSRGAAYKRALIRKNRRKFANRKANTQQRNIALEINQYKHEKKRNNNNKKINKQDQVLKM